MDHPVHHLSRGSSRITLSRTPTGQLCFTRVSLFAREWSKCVRSSPSLVSIRKHPSPPSTIYFFPCYCADVRLPAPIQRGTYRAQDPLLGTVVHRVVAMLTGNGFGVKSVVWEIEVAGLVCHTLPSYRLCFKYPRSVLQYRTVQYFASRAFVTRDICFFPRLWSIFVPRRRFPRLLITQPRSNGRAGRYKRKGAHTHTSRRRKRTCCWPRNVCSIDHRRTINERLLRVVHVPLHPFFFLF